MSDVFQEVEEEYRRQQVAQLWEKYRVPLVGGAVALVLGVASYQGWSWWHTKQVEKSSREIEAIGELIVAEKGVNKDVADRLAKLGANGAGGYPLLAKFQEAGARAELHDFKAAVAIYDGIVKSVSEPLFRDFASIRAAVLLSEVATYDDMKKRLDPVAAAKGPWQMQAKELLAYAAWRAGKNDEALKLYDELSKAEGVATGVKRRAFEMSTLIGTGLKHADVKPPAASVALPDPGGPLLLPPTEPQPGASSLLGPAIPTPAIPTPTVPTPGTPTPTAPAPTTPTP